MLRVLFIEILPFFVPFAAYFFYVRLRKRTGYEFEKHPWVWLTLTGFVLVGLTLAVFGFSHREPAGSAYEPPRLENGKVVPGKFKWRE